MTQALAISSGKIDKANTIAIWFEKFNCLLKQIFEDESVELVFMTVWCPARAARTAFTPPTC